MFLYEISEVSRLGQSDLIFRSTYVKVFVDKNKTAIYREGIIVFSLKKLT